MENTILVVEDDPELQEVLALNLQNAGYKVLRASSIRQAEALVNATLPQLILLDWMLPDTPGLSFARKLRSETRTAAVPIILLTGRDGESDKITGLEAGADDYLIKPFDIAEFEARVRVLLRRQAGLHSATVSFGGLSLDLNSRAFFSGATPLDIPARELGLLEILFMRAGKVVAKEAIIQSLTAFDDDISANAIEQYVSRLRKRLSPYGLTVKTARGIGYYLDKLPEAS